MEGTALSKPQAQVDPLKYFPRTIFLDHVQMAFEYIQDRRLDHLTEQSLSVLGCPNSEIVFLDVQRETPVFQCVPVASCPVWASLEKVRVYLCIVSADIYIYIDDFPLPCSYSGRALSVALAVLDRGDALVQHLCFSFQHVHGCLVVGSPALGATLHSCLSSTEEKDSLTSLKPLAMLSLMQPRVPFLVFAVKAQGWSMFNLVSFRMPRSFSVELLSSWVAPNYTDVWDSSSPSAGLHNSPC